MDINKEICYDWTFPWNRMGDRKPKVNLLMKAVIDENISEMDRLVSMGAKIEALDITTFQRVLYYKINNIDIINFFIALGARGCFYDYLSNIIKNCISEAGTQSGSLALAYYRNAYDVYKLLAENGYSDDYIRLWDNIKGYHIIGLNDMILARNDVNALKILLENGYSRERFLDGQVYIYRKNNNCTLLYRNPKNLCIQFLKQNPVYHRKTLILSPYLLFCDIKKPKIQKLGLFHRKETALKNKLVMDDYNDIIQAKKHYFNTISKKDLERIKKQFDIVMD